MGLLTNNDSEEETDENNNQSKRTRSSSLNSNSNSNDPRLRSTNPSNPSKASLKIEGPHTNGIHPIVTVTDPVKRVTSITNAPLPKSPSVNDQLSNMNDQFGSGMPKSPSQPNLSYNGSNSSSSSTTKQKSMTNAPLPRSASTNYSTSNGNSNSPANAANNTASRLSSSVSSWWNSTGKGSPYKKGATPTKDQLLEEMKKRIVGLEEELKMGDNFKRSMRETLGLQIDALDMELQIERDKVYTRNDNIYLFIYPRE